MRTSRRTSYSSLLIVHMHVYTRTATSSSSLIHRPGLCSLVPQLFARSAPMHTNHILLLNIHLSEHDSPCECLLILTGGE